MALPPGTRLNEFEVLSLLGAGGMGEVYRARDTKLGREVAVKILPEDMAQDKERIGRFEREGKLLAQLNHPGIATLHGVAEDGGRILLVMELVEGETLADRIARGPIPWKEAEPLFHQIAEALEAAHEKGVLHRDLKPGNIRITPEGRVKVLDFGLAKALHEEAKGANESRSPTLTKGTALGVILGTASYMSPEQARGDSVDRRVDIWAFGCCLYEALTGKRPFDGETTTDVLAAVLKNEPDWRQLPEATPPSVRRLLRRSLTKDRRSRLQSIGDARLEIEERNEPVAAVRRPRRAPRVAFFAFAALAASYGLWRLAWPAQPGKPLVRRVEIALPETDNLRAALLGGSPLAISPDGSRIVYAASRSGATRQLFLREMSSGEIEPLPGTEGVFQHFFSPDGEWVGFFAQRKIKKVALREKLARDVCDLSGLALGGSWGSDDFIYFGQRGSGGAGIFRVSSAGGEPTQVTRTEGADELDHRWPELLPNAEGILYTSIDPEWANPGINVYSLETGESRTLTYGGNPRYLGTGHVLLRRWDDDVLALPFDSSNLETKGSVVSVVEKVGTAGFSLAFDVSREGTLIYLPSVPGEGSEMVWVDRKGVSETLEDSRAAHRANVRLSPDGKRVATAHDSGQIWIYELERGVSTRLTLGETMYFRPIWTPDGKSIVLARGIANIELFVLPADGSGEERRLTTGGIRVPYSVSPDGSLVFFRELKNDWDIGMVRLDGSAPPEALLDSFYSEHTPMISPDGEWLAYVSDESGTQEIYVRPFPALEPKTRISADGGTEPLWARNGRELFYRKADKMLSVGIVTTPELAPGTPVVLFEGRYVRGDNDTSPSTSYDVTEDGSRFLMLRRLQAPEPPRIEVVFGWFEELSRLAPVP
jgi:serine/threonine-protein kinase